MPFKKVLVVGGAGYIGAHMCKMLHGQGIEVTVLDNLETGHEEAVKWGRLIKASTHDTAALTDAFAENSFDAVMHFAANSLVGESVSDPYKYYWNNFSGTLNLLQIMRDFEVRYFVFSSTAAVFGEPQTDVIDESHPINPINPYGASKSFVERALSDAANAYGLRSVSLRYFNAAGGDPAGEIGESHEPETHLIPRLCAQAAGEDIDMKIYGEDYPTRDGTCLRDYVHVNDLCSAHLQALKFLHENPGAHYFNLGTGDGFTVREIVRKVKAVTGVDLNVLVVDNRPGDPARLVASSDKARKILGWLPRHGIDDIIKHAYAWHQSRLAKSNKPVN